MMTVMFSSRNGRDVLERTLTSMARADQPTGGWKLIAVDNASSDETAQIIGNYRDRLPLTLLSEPESGKNRALNRALSFAEGDLFVFCDDDVVVAPDWLVRWREVADANPQYDLFAGATLPLWPSEPPAWILEEVDQGVAFATNPHMREGPCDAVALFGTNMAIRATVFESGIRFNSDIGPSDARAYPMGSETELARRLSKQGLKAWFAQGPCVQHIIRSHQMHRRSMLMRAYRWGRGVAHMNVDHHYTPMRLERKNVLRWALYAFLMPLLHHKEAWARQWEWASDQGYEDGWRERRNMRPRWLAGREEPHIAKRFR